MAYQNNRLQKQIADFGGFIAAGIEGLKQFKDVFRVRNAEPKKTLPSRPA